MRLGANESTAGGLFRAFAHGEAHGCDVMQVFTRSSRQWAARALGDDTVEAWRAERSRSQVAPVAAHAGYLINLATTAPHLLVRSREAVRDELERCGKLGVPWLILHPGCHLGAGEAAGLAQLAAELDHALEEADATGVNIALENTAGQGTSLGHHFEHLRDVIGQSRYPARLAVCLDTCHAWATGWDLRDEAGYEAMFGRFARAIGLDRLVVFHLNDSKTALGSRRDRHARIGEGMLGLEGFRRLMNDPRFEAHPGILETPKFPDGRLSFADGIRVLRSLEDRPRRDRSFRGAIIR